MENNTKCLTKSVALVGFEPKMELNELGLAYITKTTIYVTCERSCLVHPSIVFSNVNTTFNDPDDAVLVKARQLTFVKLSF